MGKAKALKHNADKGKQQLHEIKGGSKIKKNKDSKLKNAPKGKVNNSKEILQMPSPKVSFANKSPNQKHTPNKNKVSKKHRKPSPNGNAVAKQSKQDSPNKKQNLKRSTNSSKARKIGKKTFNPRKTEKQLDKSNSNITESEDDCSFESDDPSESDSDIPNIFDKSLTESDDDDEDYEEDEEKEDMDDDDDSDEELDDSSDEEEMSEREGVKMFKGLPSKTKKNKKVQKKDDDTDDNTYETTTENTSDEDDIDEDEDKEEKKKDNYIGKSKFKVVKQHIKIDPKVLESSTSNDINYDSDEDAELGTKALLGKSIADDDDDEDFNAEDEDSNDEDDISSEEDSENDNTKRKANDCITIGMYNITKTERDNLARRIILIDNIPKLTPSYEIAELCAEVGEYEIFEARPYPAFFIDSKPKSIELMEWLNRDYPNLETFSANVLYKTRHEALRAMKLLNGTMFAGNYLNVITADLTEQEPDYAVYVTNIKKTMPDNCLWDMFKRCGNIVRIRNVHDPFTGLNRGFGYVAFDDEEAVRCALKLNGARLFGRRIKVMPYPYRQNASLVNMTEEIKRKNQGIKRILSLGDNNQSSKKFKKSSSSSVQFGAAAAARYAEAERIIKKRKKQGKDLFQERGQWVDLKNKKKSIPRERSIGRFKK